MNTPQISGLVVQINLSQTIYLSRRDSRAVVVELRLVSTTPTSQQAVLAVAVGGDTADVADLGLLISSRTVTVTAERPVEVLPGVQLALRGQGGRHHVHPRAASLVINANQVWLIERAKLVDQALRASGHFLGKGEAK